MHSPRARSLRRARRTMIAVALAVAALPAAAAQAAEVTLAGTEIVVTDTTGFKERPEDNRLIAEALPSGELKLIDQVPLASKTSTCLAVSSFEVRCIRPSNSPISKLVYRARAGDDQLRPAGSLPIRFEAGDGADLYVGARSAAGTRVEFVDDDEDSVRDLDLAHYTNAATRVDVSKDGVANDGRPGLDRDNIDADVEIVTGTHFDDRLVGRSSPPGVAEEFQPRGGNDVVLSSFRSNGVFTRVDMGAAKDGADKILGAGEVSYAQRANPIRASLDLERADDGEAGEGDDLVDVLRVRGGSGADTMFVAARGFGAELDGGAGNDRLTGTNLADRLTGGPGRDFLSGFGGNDKLFTDDFDIDRVLCDDGSDVARTDTAEEEISGCETVERVGKLALAPKALTAEAGETARLRLSWTHPQSWRKLRAITLKLRTRDRVVGRVVMRPHSGRIADAGAVELARKRSHLAAKGKAVTARLALRLDDSLAGQALTADVEATDRRGRRQLERNAGTVRVTP